MKPIGWLLTGAIVIIGGRKLFLNAKKETGLRSPAQMVIRKKLWGYVEHEISTNRGNWFNMVNNTSDDEASKLLTWFTRDAQQRLTERNTIEPTMRRFGLSFNDF